MLKRYPVLFILTFFLLLCATGRAQNSVTVKRVLEGSKNELVTNATLEVQDSVYFNTDRNKLVLPYQIRNVITFKVDEYNKAFLPEAYTASITVLLTYTYLDGSGNARQDTVSTILKVNSDTSRAHDPRASFVFNNAQKVIAKIVNVQVSKPAAIKALVLENEMNILPVYKLDRTADAVKNLQYSNPSNTGEADEITVTWNAVTGADMYDLEWAYIDYSVLSKYQSQPSLIFENNATRVSIRGNSYSIPLLYDNAGSLFVRVRAVQQQNKKARLYTVWSTEVPGASLVSYAFSGHQQKLNWQSDVTYAEDGKRKAVVQYFDGSLRSRQTVTKDNVTQRTIVGETYYDQQGRPAVQVLPSPSLSNIIQYSRGFNLSATLQEYGKDQYDHLASPLDYRTAHAAPLDSTFGGAGQYYSSLNPEKDNGVNRFIPAAGGYPLTETVYTPDNTGRISKQGGVGPEYQVASGHETVYAYGGATQNQLDVLFGTEVGDEKHYFRNTVRDANGQYSVSYLDMHGRTIATALSGSPENAGLKDLESKNTIVVTDSLATAGKNLVQDLVAVAHKTQQVETKGKYSFRYSLTPPVVTVNSCAGTPLSYIGLYELEIRITDNENNQLLPGGEPYVKVLRNYNAGQIVESGITQGPIEVSFDLVLDKGSYEITKSLRISKEGLEYYKEKHLPQAVCKSLSEFEQEQWLVTPNYGCYPDCSACMAQLESYPNFRDLMLAQMGWNAPDDSVTHRKEIQLAYNKAVEDCKALCQYDTPYDEVRKAMLLDVSAPSGQYADPLKLQDIRSVFYTDGTSPAPYARVTGDYLDANGQPSLVYDPTSGLYVKPQLLQPAQFAESFQPSWAENLLPFHPEYGLLVKYETFKPSMEWDAKVREVDTYQQAWTNAYLNPTNNPSYSPFQAQTAGMDALARYNNGALKTELENSLVNYTEGLPLWSVAAISVICDPKDNACRVNRSTIYTSMSQSSAISTGDKNMMWRVFRDLYIGIKQRVIYNQLRAACPDCPTDAQLAAEGRNPNFLNDMGALNTAYGELLSKSSEEVTRARSEAYLQQQYKENCKNYVQTWIKQLSKCTYYNQAALTEITDKLLEVCMQGADRDHPMGASSVRPSSTATLRSFEDVINDYNKNHFITASETCNGMLVTIPAPYEKQQPVGSKPLFSKPSDCECTRINALYKEYETFGQPAGDASFSAYLLRTRKVTIDEGNLTTLRNACNGQFAGHFFVKPIELPALLQCNTGGTCITCVEFNGAYNSYVANYPLMLPTAQPATENDVQFNILFENYMNNRLGLNRRAADYLAFKDSCAPGSYVVDSVCSGSGLGVIYAYTVTPGLTRDMVVKDMKQTGDNGFIMVGSVIRNNGSGADEDACIMKVDANSNVQWAKVYSSAGNDYFSKVRRTNDGGYILGGKTTKKDNGILSGQAGMITKINSSGVQQWTRAMDANTYFGEDVRDVLELTNGDIAFAGCHNLTSGQSKFLVGVISRGGDSTRWIKRIGRNNIADMAYRIEQDRDTIALLGLTNASNFYGAALMKLNRMTGSVISNNLYSNSSTKNDIGEFFKTDFGYRLSLIESIDWGNSRSQLVILDVQKEGSVRPTSRTLSGTKGTDHLAVAQTPDMGLVISPVYNAPDGYSFVKLNANNDVTWANYNTYQVAAANTVGAVVPVADSFVAAIHIGGRAGMLGLDSLGRAGCSDSAYSTVSSFINYSVNYNYQLDVDILLTDINKPFQFTVTDGTPLSNTTGCGTVRSCASIYKGSYLCPVATDASGNPGVPGSVNDISGCSDNTFFVKSKSVELYRQYRDSVSNNFEQQYLSSVRDAFNKEQFTVIHDESEYHYTLYYYDQAGNLLKTVPPQGVAIDTTINWLKRVRSARAAGQTLVPPHTLVTNYRYNSLNQVMAQQSPDGGMTRFWYDRLGRLAVSQNARQAPNLYSYTLYDDLGRVTEVGELSNSEAMTPELSRSRSRLSQWAVNAGPSRKQITRTVYDQPNNLIAPVLSSNNVRNRVSYSMVYDNIADTTAAKYNSATFYSYDIHGNVDTLVQDYKRGTMADSMNRFKKVIYDYDLLSGKVNQVAYQPGNKDALYHRYIYDAENRLTNVETSHDSIYWENEAFYQYYKHGPLARAVIGQQQVQGIDYAYTLQGWLKGVNGSVTATDMGNDGMTASPVAQDAFGFTLHYYGNRDYRPIGTSVKSLAGINTFAGFRPLYNGNIAAMGVHLPILGEPLLYTYQYDVLHRIAGMDANRSLDATSNNWTPQTIPDFQERVTYDGNGNILKYLRNGNNTFAGKPLQMDSLRYFYKPGTNQLDYIRDAIGNTAYGSDIDNQSAHNYTYDAIGNLTSDRAAGIDSIVWNVYGKIKRIRKTNGTIIDFSYDVAGNRISKNVNGVQTLYVRDATGNVLSVYAANDAENGKGRLIRREAHLYGSSRLGMSTRQVVVDTAQVTLPAKNGIGIPKMLTFTRGEKLFELSNHLGNVLATVSDRKKPVSVDGTQVDHYEPVISSAQDYYPFGSLMPGRSGYLSEGGWNNGGTGEVTIPATLTVNSRSNNTPAEYAASEWIDFTVGFESGISDAFVAVIKDAGSVPGEGGDGTVGTARGYRYGFNGKENDNEVKGEGNQQDYGMRIYDPRVARFLSVDPVTKEFPWYTPYQFAGNKPIKYIDLDGAEEAEPASAGPVMRPILGGLRTPAPMAAYARYGVSSAGFAYEENPLSTHEQIKAEEAFRREEYIRNSLMIGGKWVPRSEDEVRNLRIQASISAVNKYNESLKAPLYGTNVSLPTQYIREQRTDKQVSGDYYAIHSTLVNGRFQSRGKGMTGEYDIVVLLDGTIKLGKGHYYLSMSAKHVQLAGTVQMYDGRVKSITNLSGHYLPSEAETSNFGKILKRYGVKVSGASLHTYKLENEKTVKVGKTKID
ncbi:RHS repeat-associated core domain-containing protein [Chitinophaga eiseniae]|uniref:RHS repeat-associated core domain-containing protein n=1 Tax=Chitinophaga eiseniae TaxID=634771 RepID=A0A1T4TID5_9BACT|nr:RHS repeat-associated core domain-containing protein [Chitinophaga eiseniae]SKA40210.1 RHS repeat-associated core domain-containing protein [Chitinophaga eiseniae]